MQTPSTVTTGQSMGTDKRVVTLFGSPVSNYTARCRYLVYRKDIEEKVNIRSPADMGGIKSDDFLKLNPLGKMPAAVVHGSVGSGGDEAIYESAVICEYLAERFIDDGPSFVPNSAERRARARIISALLDTYMGSLHPYMYKKDVSDDRATGAAKMQAVFDAIENSLDEEGPYAVGDTLSIADCCLWGNWPFYDFMLPTFFGWSPTDGRPKLAAWRKMMTSESKASKRVYNEVFDGLQGWWDNDRWVKIGMEALTGRPESNV